MNSMDDISDIDVPHWLEMDAQTKLMGTADVMPVRHASGDTMNPKSYIVMLTTGPEDGGKRATLAFSAACTAIAMDFTTRVFLIGDGGHWAQEGVCEGICQPGFPELVELVETFLNLEGKIYLCAACDSTAVKRKVVKRHMPKVLPLGLAPTLAHMVGSTTVTF